MRFEYIARDETGRTVKGTARAKGRVQLSEALRLKGLAPISVVAGRRPIDFINDLLGQMGGGVTRIDRAIFTKHLALMLRSGLTIAESLDVLMEQSKSGRLRRVIKSLHADVMEGQSFVAGLNRFPRIFPNYYSSIVAAGEMSGTIEQNLSHLAEQMSKEHELTKRVRTAMLYPVIVLVAALVIAYLFSIFVIPEIVDLFRGLSGVRLPLYTRIMISVANVVRAYPVLSFIAIFGGLAGAVWFVRRRFLAPVTHWLLLHLPVVGKISRDVNLARFSMVMATLMRAGIDIISAVHVTERVVGNVYYKNALKDAVAQVQRGRTMSDAFEAHRDLFPLVVNRMLAVGERTGNLEEVLTYLTEFYELEVETTMKNLSTILEPVMLMLVGGLALLLAMSILMPIYDFINSIRNI
jgi:type II secretory pathway component PulF